MGEKEVLIIDGDGFIELSPTAILSPASDGTPLRPILVLKRNMDDFSQFDQNEDCFILDFNPFDSIQRIADLSVSAGSPQCNDDVSVVAEKGQVACRDYPHSRHLCVKYPFGTTAHEKHCGMCFCYVCDQAAPCKYWNDSESGHCHASGNSDEWKFLRQSSRKQPIV